LAASPLARIRAFKSRRVSSWDRSGGNLDAIVVEPGERTVFAAMSGAGIVRHL
jgi:hypothetical protein